MDESIIGKIERVLVCIGELNIRFDNLDKKFDSIEKELAGVRSESSKHLESIIRLEVVTDTLLQGSQRDIARLEERLKEREEYFTERLKAHESHFDERLKEREIYFDERVDKKLLALKLALFMALSAVAISIAQIAFDVIKWLR